MHQIDMREAEAVGGAGLASYLLRKAGEFALTYIGQEVMAGNVDYAGLAESQGTYYNTVGA